jgi:hypothetical protein
MIAAVDAFNAGRYDDADALAQLALVARPGDQAALELVMDCRRVRHGGGGRYHWEIRNKYRRDPPDSDE